MPSDSVGTPSRAAESSIALPGRGRGSQDDSGAIEPTLLDRAHALPSLELLGEFGCVDCSGPALFGRIVSVAAGDGGRFLVLTDSPPHARVWDLDAGEVHQFGEKGEGPRELVRPLGASISSDTVLIFDGRGSSSRLVMFDSIGAYLGYRQPFDVSTVALGQEYTSSPSGIWNLWTGVPVGSGAARILRMRTGAGSAISQAIAPELLSGLADPRAATNVSAAVSDDGTVALGYGDTEYRLTLSSEAGALAFGGRDIPRQLRSEEELDTLDAVLRRTIGRTLDRNAAALRPHFGTDALRFDALGRLWVRTMRGADPNWVRGHIGTTVFDVFAPDLTYLGEIDAGSPVNEYHIGPEILVASSIGTLGVPVVKVWRIMN